MGTRGKVPYSKLAAAIAHDNGLTKKALELRSPRFRKDYELFKKQAVEQDIMRERLMKGRIES
jgi:hypothetical protein